MINVYFKYRFTNSERAKLREEILVRVVQFKLERYLIFRS